MQMTCSRCNGTGIDPQTGTTCTSCNGSGIVEACWYQAVTLRQETMQSKLDGIIDDVSDIKDKVNDIKEKCDDIWTKLNE